MKSLSLFLALFLAASSFAQDRSVALVELPDGSTGSCVVIDRYKQVDDGWLGYAVTAAHVTEGRTIIRVKYLNGRSSSNCPVIVSDKNLDLSIVQVWCPEEALPVQIADNETFDEVTLLGYPSGEFGSLRGRFLHKINGSTYSDIFVRPGFSGGGAFADGKLIGCISGGWMWMRDEEDRQATWPTRAGGVEGIKRLLEAARLRQ